MLESPVGSLKNLVVLLGFQMKGSLLFLLALICSLLLHSAFAQSGRVKDTATTTLTSPCGNVSGDKDQL